MVLFANNCQNDYEKQVISNAPRNHKLEGVKIIVLFKKVILTWVGVPYGQVEK